MLVGLYRTGLNGAISLYPQSVENSFYSKNSKVIMFFSYHFTHFFIGIAT